jgi:aspartate-semialdehyde dehydrogenase
MALNIQFTEMRFHNVIHLKKTDTQGRRNETSSRDSKILGDKTIAVTATAVRVPIVGGHMKR